MKLFIYIVSVVRVE